MKIRNQGSSILNQSIIYLASPLLLDSPLKNLLTVSCFNQAFNDLYKNNEVVR